MAMSVQKLFPGTQVTIGPWIDRGFYYDFDTKQTISQEDLKGIKKEMQRIIKKKLPFVREEVHPLTHRPKASCLQFVCGTTWGSSPWEGKRLCEVVGGGLLPGGAENFCGASGEGRKSEVRNVGVAAAGFFCGPRWLVSACKHESCSVSPRVSVTILQTLQVSKEEAARRIEEIKEPYKLEILEDISRRYQLQCPIHAETYIWHLCLPTGPMQLHVVAQLSSNAPRFKWSWSSI